MLLSSVFAWNPLYRCFILTNDRRPKGERKQEFWVLGSVDVKPVDSDCFAQPPVVFWLEWGSVIPGPPVR